MTKTTMTGPLAAIGVVVALGAMLLLRPSVSAQTATPTPTPTATATATSTATATATATPTATTTATATPTATSTPVSGTGTFASTPVFSSGGLSQVVFGGGTIAQLDSAIRAVPANGAWAQGSTGEFKLYIAGGATFVNEPFVTTFSTGFPGVVALTLVRNQ